MRSGYKVFDADAHVIYPPDLWSRFLDARHRDRVGRRAPAGLDHYNPVTVDGRFSQHPTSIYGQFQKAINWTADDMVDQVRRHRGGGLHRRPRRRPRSRPKAST